MQKTLKKAREKESGSEAGAKRQARKPWKNVEIIESASLPLRSGSVPASSPWSLNATMIISMSRCQGLLPRKNHQKTRVVYQGQFTHQKIHQVVATKKSPWNPRSVNATMIIPIYLSITLSLYLSIYLSIYLSYLIRYHYRRSWLQGGQAEDCEKKTMS